MAITISVPHFKETSDGPNVKNFSTSLESMLEIKDMPYYIVRGNTSKAMIDLTTSQAKGTSHNKELSTALGVSDYHIELHAYDFDTHKDWTESDFMLGDLAGYTNEELLQRYEDTISSVANVGVVDIVPLGHYSTVLSELVYEIPSIVVYVNADSNQLYSTVAEGITDIIAYYEDRRTA